MRHSFLDVLCGWLFVLFVDLSVLYLFYKISKNSVLKPKDSPSGENNNEPNQYSVKPE